MNGSVTPDAVSPDFPLIMEFVVDGGDLLRRLAPTSKPLGTLADDPLTWLPTAYFLPSIQASDHPGFASKLL